MKIQGRKKLIALSMLAALIALPGCKSPEGQNESNSQEQHLSEESRSVSITPKFSALFDGRANSKSRSVRASTSYFSGTLDLVDQANQPIDGSPFQVTVLLDEVKRTATLNQTFALNPGSYTGTINLKGNGHQYIGNSTFTINDGENPIVNLSVHPVIGGTVEIGSITYLNRVRFQYPTEQLNQFNDPKLGISINGSTQEIYSINQQDSSNDQYRFTDGYVDLEAGNNKIELAFFDGQDQIRVSHPEQEIKEIFPGENIKMDIIPLEGNLDLSLSINGGDAEIAVELPNVINDISADRMEVRVSLIQGDTVKSQAQGDLINARANLTLSSLFYGDYTLLMELFDGETKFKLGECRETTTLGNSQPTACNLRFHRSYITSSGNLLSSVHVTVLNENGFPVNGAIVRLDEITKTTSGGGDASGDASGDVSGYGHFYQKPGTYKIKAKLNNLIAVQTVTLNALQSKNLFLKLAPLPMQERLALGSGHGCLLKENGSIACWGDNSHGGLGSGETDNGYFLPRQVVGISEAISIVASGGLSATNCALLYDKTVKCWGSGSKGELGTGDSSMYTSNVPVTVTGLSNVKSISGGNDRFCATLENGTVQCWGNNMYGHLDASADSYLYSPNVVPGLSEVESISLESNFFSTGFSACALLRSGSLSCWGDNYPSDVSSDFGVIEYSPKQVTGISNVAQLSIGYDASFALLNSGELYAWGRGTEKLPDPIANLTDYTPPTRVLSGLKGIRKISTGSFHACVLLEDQTVQCWGRNGNGELGIGNKTGDYTTPQPVLNLSNVLDIKLGYSYSCALLDNDKVKCWGSASSWGGQNGHGQDYDSYGTPLPVLGIAEK